MARAPLQFSAVMCKHCNAIVALIPPGALVYDTRLRCANCGVTIVIVKPTVDMPSGSVYTTSQPA
jgi:ribosomal protein S27E